MPDTNTELAVVISELNNKIGTLIEKQEEMAENINKIKEAIYDPQQGLFSRLRDIEIWKSNLMESIQERLTYHTIKEGELRMTQVEGTVTALKKIQWLVIGTAVTTITALMIKHFVLL
jgi:hypothetical protein